MSKVKRRSFLQKSASARSLSVVPGTDTPRWEQDKKDGSHRIVCGELFGQWVPYVGVATLKIGDVVYRAASDYFHGSLPTGVVFVAQEVR